jgi:hypothetical protein
MIDFKKLLKEIDKEMEYTFEPPTQKQVEKNWKDEDIGYRIIPYSEWLQQYYQELN